MLPSVLGVLLAVYVILFSAFTVFASFYVPVLFALVTSLLLLFYRQVQNDLEDEREERKLDNDKYAASHRLPSPTPHSHAVALSLTGSPFALAS